MVGASCHQSCDSPHQTKLLIGWNCIFCCDICMVQNTDCEQIISNIWVQIAGTSKDNVISYSYIGFNAFKNKRKKEK